jgi:hypothetical protein
MVSSHLLVPFIFFSLWKVRSVYTRKDQWSLLIFSSSHPLVPFIFSSHSSSDPIHLLVLSSSRPLIFSSHSSSRPIHLLILLIPFIFFSLWKVRRVYTRKDQWSLLIPFIFFSLWKVRRVYTRKDHSSHSSSHSLHVFLMGLSVSTSTEICTLWVYTYCYYLQRN